MNKEAKFIVMAGVAGGGKSTLTKWIQRVWPTDRELVVAREPGGTEICEAFRYAVQSPEIDENRHVLTSLFGYSACRAQLINTVGIPTIESGKDFWLDRYWESTWGYQGQELPKVLIWATSMIATRGLLPNKWLYLTGDIEFLMRRKEQQKKGLGSKDDVWDLQPDKVEFAKKTDKSCRQLGCFYPRRWVNIDATGTFGQKANRIAEVLATEGIILRDVPAMDYDIVAS